MGHATPLTRRLYIVYCRGVDGGTLRRLRKGAGLTQVALAERLAVTANTVARWERDEVRITDAMARLITLTLTRPSAPSKRKGH